MSDTWAEYMSLDADKGYASDVSDNQIDWLLAQKVNAPSAKPDTLYGSFRERPRFVTARNSKLVPPGAFATGLCILDGAGLGRPTHLAPWAT